MTTPKPPLLTPETLQSLSQEDFTSIRELVEAEDLARLTAAPLSYPMPGQHIRTPERAVQLAHESGMALRYESLMALCLSRTHEALAVYHVHYGQRCPLPLDLDLAPLIQAATACQTNRMIMIRYHPHPYFLPIEDEAEEIKHCRLAAKHAGVPLYNYVIVDRDGTIVSIRDWGHPPRIPAPTCGVAPDA
jgi:hypothetical protein